MNFSRLAILCLSVCYCANANAAITPISEYLSTHVVSSVGWGPVWGDGGSTQTLVLGPGITKTYTANQPANNMLDGELFVGVNQSLPHSLQGQFGLAVVATGYANLSGDIWDDASPKFDNYTYQYQLRHTHLALKGKLLIDKHYFVIPWISMSVGVGFNNASNFISVPTTLEAVAMPGFASHTMTSFTYTLGVGVQRQINQHWQIGAGYEFADWGRSQLSPAAGQVTTNVLSQSHFYTSGLMVNATFMA